MMVLGAMLLMPFALFANGIAAQDIGSNTIFLTFVSLVASIPLVVELIKKFLKSEIKIVNQIISWITGIAMSMAGWLFGLGFLAGTTWYYALIIGIFASLAANGVYDTKFYEWLLQNTGILKKPNK